MIMITHDLGVVAQVCDRVGVMYAGQLVEVAPVIELFSNPLHPYTKALLAAVPSRRAKRGELAMIAGEIPDLTAPPPGCRFAPRCPHRMDGCDERPELKRHGGSEVACWSVETGPADRGGVR
jgi:oligopeptide/dipeptide ABC transporter ATP-binding protein